MLVAVSEVEVFGCVSDRTALDASGSRQILPETTLLGFPDQIRLHQQAKAYKIIRKLKMGKTSYRELLDRRATAANMAHALQMLTGEFHPHGRSGGRHLIKIYHGVLDSSCGC
jgi:hypothetical protein